MADRADANVASGKAESTSPAETVRAILELLRSDDPDRELPYEMAAERADYYREACGPFLDPAIETEVMVELPAGMATRYSGIEGWWEFWFAWLEEWDDYRFSVDGMEEHGDQVVFDVHIATKGRHSGVPLTGDLTHLWTIRAGRLRRARIFASRRRALAALGNGERG